MTSSTERPDVFMPLYIGDYLAGTSRLTTEQHGAYLLLIFDYWMNGPLPDNDQVLASVTRMSLDAWSNARGCLEHFFSIENGQWKHKRVEQELATATEKKAKAKAKAKAAAEAKWAKQGKKASNSEKNASSSAPSNAPSTAQAMLEICPSPSPSPSDKDSNVLSDITVTNSLPASSKPKKSTRTTKTSLDPDTELTIEQAKRATLYWREIGRDDLEAFGEFEKFKAHHLANGNKMANWDAAWTTWYIRAPEMVKPPYQPRPLAPPPAPQHQSSKEPHDAQV